MRHTALVALYRSLIKLRIIKVSKRTANFWLNPVKIDDYVMKFSLQEIQEYYDKD
jgi:hypothetical protein